MERNPTMHLGKLKKLWSARRRQRQVVRLIGA